MLGRDNPGVSSPAAQCLNKIEWQRTLFAETARRMDILALDKPGWPLETVKVRVHRNHGFELIENVVHPFAAFSGLQVDFNIGDYDDSLAFSGAGEADVEIIWLEFSRYDMAQDVSTMANWFLERISALRARTAAPLLIADWAGADDPSLAQDFNRRLGSGLENIPGVYLCPLAGIAEPMGDYFVDLRAEKFSGTRLSDRAAMEVARHLGLQWLPAVLRPGLKAIAVDLDNTLYDGVLGEEGADKLDLTAGHTVLQKRLLTLRDKGLFLAVVSRNQLADAEKLFETRTDFPLKRDDFSAFEVNWGSKAESVGRAAAALRIGIDSILFVDDNPGELAEVASAFPAVHTLYAEENADDTARALMMYPGIFRWRVGDDDIKRVQDLAATTLREIEASIVGEATDPLAYLGELDTRLAFSFNDTRHLSRLAELSQKTNQFNLSLTRIAELEMEKLINAPDVAVVGVELNDKLSASGIIGMLVVRIREGMAEVEEICISCRALGRRLEDLMISEALCRAGQSLGGISKVTFHYDIGPRNRPAVDWLEHYSGEPTGSKAGRIDLDWNEKYAQNLIGTYPVTITWAE